MKLEFVKVEQCSMTVSCSLKKLMPKEQKLIKQSLEAFLSQAQEFLRTHSDFKISKRLSLELSLTLCGLRKIKSLNNQYRSKNKATDVLSFPFEDNLRINSIAMKDFPHYHLGDIIICWPIAIKQAEEFKISPQMELIHLLCHGFLHLLGYDHELSQKEADLMFKLEDSMVQKIYKDLKL